MLEELGVEQPSATEVMVSEKVPVSKSGQRSSAGRREDLNLPGKGRQQQPRKQEPVKIKHTDERLYPRESVARYSAGKSRSIHVTRPQEKQSKQRPRSPQTAPVLYGLRLLILGVGIGAIAGTLLSILDPASRLTAKDSQPQLQAAQQSEASAAIAQASALKLSQEIMPLRTSVQQLAAKNTKLLPGVFLFPGCGCR